MKKLHSLLTLLVLMVFQLNAANISVGNITVEDGQAAQLTISLSNTETNLSGFQFKLYLPEGASLAKNAKGKFIYTLGERIADHTLSITALSDGGYQFIAYSMDGDIITGSSGALLSVSVDLIDSFSSVNGSVSDIRLTDLDAHKTTCSDVSFSISRVVKATAISLNTTSLTLTFAGQTSTLTPILTPSNTTNTNVTWVSSNTSVATVSEAGVVTAVASGTATITATTTDGSNKSATCSVTASIIPIITFADANVKALCVANWDTNGDGELDEDEAAAVTSLGEVFKNNTTITSFDELQYFTGLSTMNENAFYGCSELASVTIPNSVTSLENSVFERCSSLTSITIPNSVTSLGAWVFKGCSGLTSAIIGNSVTSLGQSVFNSCTGLTSITIPESMTSIGPWAFDHCTGLTRAEFASIESLCNISFDNEYANPLYFAHHLYVDEQEVTDLVVPEGVTSVGVNAFRGCSGLTSVTLPSTLTSTGNYSFRDCTGLTAVHISDLEAYCRISFGWYTPLFYAHKLYLNDEEVTGKLVIPDGITSVSNVAFEGCTGITSVVIPEGVTSIGQAAFKSTNITSVSLPESLTSISPEAFQNCSSLTSVTCMAENMPTTGANAFLNVPQSTATLYVPGALLNAYKAADQWSSFGIISKTLEDDVDYYIMNVETDLFLGGQNDWGTKATVSEDAGIFRFVKGELNGGAGGYNIVNTLISVYNKNLSTSLYVDNDGRMNVKADEEFGITRSVDGIWEIRPQGDNIFAFYCPSEWSYSNGQWVETKHGYLTRSEEKGTRKGYKLMFNEELTDAALFRVLTRDEALSHMANKAQSSNVSFNFLIKNPDFCRNQSTAAWTVSADCTNKNLCGGSDHNRCAESYHSTFTISQVVKDLPAGRYMLSAQGFYRQDGEDTENLPVVFAGETTVQLPKLEDMSINSMSLASDQFTAGKFQLDPVRFKLTAEKTDLEVGFRLLNNQKLWAIWDNIQLTSYSDVSGYAMDILNNINYPIEGVGSLEIKNTYETSYNNFKTFAEDITQGDGTTFDEVDARYALFVAAESAWKANVSAYSSYIALGAKAKKIYGQITASQYIQIPALDALNTYVNADAVAPGTVVCGYTFENGSYNDIMTARTLDNDGIAAEISFVNALLNDVKSNIKILPGMDVTFLLVNPDFTEYGGWEGISTIAKFQGGLSGWLVSEVFNNSSFDFYQVVENVPAGRYSVSVNAFYRPSYNGTWTGNEAVPVELYMGTESCPIRHIASDVIENDLVFNEGEKKWIGTIAKNGTNCYFWNGDFSGITDADKAKIWTYNENEDPAIQAAIAGSTSWTSGGKYNSDYSWNDGSATRKLVPNGLDGASIAFSAGRYPVTISGDVADDGNGTGTLRVGIRSNSQTNWASWSGFRLYYVGGSADATSVTISPAEPKLQIGGALQLNATVLPEGAFQFVTWTTSDPTVATVDENGLVTAVAAGTATITATTADGTSLTAQCNVTVEEPEPEPIKMLYAEDISASRGAQIKLPVQMDNGEEDITSFQFDVELPEGITLLGCTLSDRKANHGDPSPSQQADGSYRLTTFSGDNSLFSGTEGTLLYLTLAISTDVTPGDYDITLKNIELTTPTKAIEQSNTKSQLTVLDAIAGDANGDGKVSIFDAVQIVNYILGNNPSPFIFYAADLDGNGKITIFDAVSTVNIILNQGVSYQVQSAVQNDIEPQ